MVKGLNLRCVFGIVEIVCAFPLTPRLSRQALYTLPTELEFLPGQDHAENCSIRVGELRVVKSVFLPVDVRGYRQHVCRHGLVFVVFFNIDGVNGMANE